MKKIYIGSMGAIALIIFVGTLVSMVQAGEYRQHGAHEHGVAHLNVAVEENNLTIEFISPAANIVGFEHHPRTRAQKDQVAQAEKRLKDGKTLFHLSPEALGRMVQAMVDTDIDSETEIHDHDDHEQAEENDHGEDHHHKENEHAHEHHSDFKAEYHFHCEKPEKLRHMDVMLFDAFPGIERIEVQILTGSGQTARELTAKDHKILF